MNLRSLLLGPSLALGMAAFAQPLPPYLVNISGQVIGCNPSSYVNILTVQNTQPALDIDVPVDANCGFSIDLSMDSFQGWFVVSTACLGAIQSETVTYTVNSFFPDSNYVYVVFNCGNTNTDCLGVPGGNAQPGTACSLDGGVTFGGTWNTSCVCMPNTVTCNACFTVSQTGANPNGGGGTPWSMSVSNCTTGTGPFTYQWWMPDGSTSNSAEPNFIFNMEGVYGICLTIADAGGCTSTLCDTVVVDANGWISSNPVVYDCLQIVNGPNMPGTPCTVFGTTTPGTWSAACACVPDSTTGCQAGFWVMQAYEIDSLNPNGGGSPIPNELWIWNLSSGGSGNYQFVWSWGDGTPDSTDPYPTHFYANGGPYYLCLTMTDNNGCTDTACDSISIDGDGFYTGLAPQENAERSGFTVNVLNQLPTGIDDRPVVEETTAWPNPVEDALNLRFYTTLNGNVPMTITDMNGRVVRMENLLINAGGNNTQVQVGDLAPGLYMLRFGNDARAVALRFVKR
ncbi:MAG: T9SS type A sorting domain-containing protein [Flavobacteriales bacterium]|nr:T9SS type A sorting domain-containing protein [Flavobacteriales bacterium]